jgi:spore germination protein YaaH
MYNVSFEYDPESGQDVVTWICQFNYLNKIWLENPQSLAKRAALAEEFGLAGLAAWSLDWMDSEAQLWNTFRK